MSALVMKAASYGLAKLHNIALVEWMPGEPYGN